MKQSNGKTVWEHEEKKWKPRTYQAAKVFFPAHDLHRPPEPKKEPVFIEPPKPLSQEQIKAANSDRHSAKESANLIRNYAAKHKKKKKLPSMFKIAAKQEKAKQRMRDRIAAGKTPLPAFCR